MNDRVDPSVLLDNTFREVLGVDETRPKKEVSSEIPLSGFSQLSILDRYRKYGDRGVRLGTLLDQRISNQERVLNAERTLNEITKDSALSGLSAFLGTVGSVHSQAEGFFGGDKEGYDAERAALFNKYYTDITGSIRRDTSPLLQNKQRHFSIRSELEEQDRLKKHEQRISEGESPLVSSFRLAGEEAFDKLQQLNEEPALTTDIIASALGSLAATAPLAAAGGATTALSAKGAQRALRGKASGAATGASRTAGRFSTATPGAAAAIGAVEASGTFSEAIAEASSIPEEKIRETDEYKQAREEGLSDNEAIDRTIASIAQIAATRQLPVATALGILSAGFTRAPVRHFRGRGLVDSSRSILREGLEEAAQNSSSQLNINIPLSEVDQRLVASGIGEAAVEGFVGGIGQAGIAASPRLAGISAQATGQVVKTAFDRAVEGTRERIQSVRISDEQAQEINEATESVINDDTPEVSSENTETELQSEPESEQTSDTIVNKSSEDINSVELEGTSPEVQNNFSRDNDLSSVQETAKFINEAPRFFAHTAKDSDVLLINRQINRLESLANSQEINTETKENINKILSNPLVRSIKDKANKIDLRNKERDEEVTPEEVSETISVALNDPEKLNPERTNVVLKSIENKASPEVLHLVRQASKIANHLNTHGEKEIAIAKKNNRVGLKRQSGKSNKAQTPSEQTSKEFRVDGLRNERGQYLPSVGAIAATIFRASQSSTGTSPDHEGSPVTVAEAFQGIDNLTTHMRNKVEALNISYGKNGSSERFEGLQNLNTFISKNKWKRPVRYVPNNDNSIRFAENVYNDYQTVLNVRNELIDTFPELTDIPKTELVSLIRSEDTGSVNESEVAQSNQREQNEQSQETDETISEEQTERKTEQQRDESPSRRVEQRQKREESKEEERSSQKESTPGERNNSRRRKTSSESSESLPRQETIKSEETSEKESDVTDTDNTSDSLLSNIIEGLNEFTGDRLSIERNVFPNVTDTFQPLNNDNILPSWGEYLRQGEEAVKEGKLNPQTYRFSVILANRAVEYIKQRINNLTVTIKDGKKVSLTEAREEIHNFRKYKLLSLTDPETGQLNEDLIRLASLAVIDWMITVTPSGGRRIDNVLKDAGLTVFDVNEEYFNALTNGLPPSRVKDQLIRNIMKFWGVRPKDEGTLGNYEGIPGNLAAEFLTMLSKGEEGNRAIEIRTIPLNKENRKTQTILVRGLERLQNTVNEAISKNPEAVITNAEYFLKETPRSWVINKPIESIPKGLNRKQTTTVRRMQSIGYRADEEIASVLQAIGSDGIAELLGHYQGTDNIKILASKITTEGKNLTIFQNIKETFNLLKAYSGKSTRYFFPAKVDANDRVRYIGPNPQNNKLMRATLTPTWVIIDPTLPTDQDKINFYRIIAQATGIAKPDKEPVRSWIQRVPDEYNQRFGEATSLVQSYLKDNINSLEGIVPLLKEGLPEGEGIDPRVIAAVVNMAKFLNARENKDSTVDISLSFELDGLTNGAANMIMQFGSGEITRDVFDVWKSIGLSVGNDTRPMSEQLFTGLQDLYYKLSDSTQTEMRAIANDGGKEGKLVAPVGRLLGHFGALEVDEDGKYRLTREFAKSPFIKLNYGAGIFAIGIGITKDVLINMAKLTDHLPKGTDAIKYLSEKYDYPRLYSDLQVLTNSNNISNFNSLFTDEKRKQIENSMALTFGRAFSRSMNRIMGRDVRTMADVLVLITNTQTKFQQEYYEYLLNKTIEEKVDSGAIGVTKKGNPIRVDLTKKDFDNLENEVRKFSPSFRAEDFNVTINSTDRHEGDIQTSENLEESLNQKALTIQIQDASVKALPYIVISRGDADVIHRFFNSKDNPYWRHIFPVFDGIDVRMDQVDEISELLNRYTWESWNQNTIKLIADNLENFLSNLPEKFKKIVDSDGISSSSLDFIYDEAKEEMEKRSYGYNPALAFESLEDTLAYLRVSEADFDIRMKYLRQSDQDITVGQVVGGNSYIIQKDNNNNNIPLNDINLGIAQEKGTIPELIQPDIPPSESDIPSVTEELSAPVEISAKELVSSLSKNKKLKKHHRVLLRVTGFVNPETGRRRNIDPDFNVVIGSLTSINRFRGERHSNSPEIINANGAYDPDTNTIYLTEFPEDNPDLFFHELVHALTYNITLGYYVAPETLTSGQIRGFKELETLLEEIKKVDEQEVHNLIDEMEAAAELNNISKAHQDAVRLNEFMAHTLAHQQGVQKVAKKHSFGSIDLSKLSDRMKVIFKKAFEIITKILGKKLPGNLYERTAFATLLTTQPDILYEPEPINDSKGDPSGSAEGRVKSDSDLDIQNGGGRGNNPRDIPVNENSDVPSSSVRNAEKWESIMKDFIDQKIKEKKNSSIPIDTTNERELWLNAKATANQLSEKGAFTGEEANRVFRNIYFLVSTAEVVNPVSMTALAELVTKLEGELTPELFGRDFESRSTWSEITSVMGLRRNNGISDHMAVFLALSQTSPKFRNALNTLENTSLPEGGEGERIRQSITYLLSTRLGRLITDLTGDASIATNAKTALEATDALADAVVRLEKEREDSLLKRAQNNFDSADRALSGALERISETSSKVRREVEEESRSVTTEATLQALTYGRAIINEEVGATAAETIKRYLIEGNLLPEFLSKSLKEFFTEVVGTDDTNANLVALFDRTKAIVSGARQAYREDIPEILKSYFKNPLNEDQERVLYKVLIKSDFTPFINTSNLDKSFEVIASSNIRKNRITELKNRINNSEAIRKSKQLALYMAGKPSGPKLLRNADAIVSYHSLNSKLKDQIDELITLEYFEELETQNNDELNEFIRIWENERVGISAIIPLIQGLNRKEVSKKTITDSAKMNGWKGWSPERSIPGTYIVVDNYDKQNLYQQRGYRLIESYNPESPDLPVSAIYTTDVAQGGTFSQGISQNIRDTFNGVNIQNLQSISGASSQGLITGKKLLNKLIQRENDQDKLTFDQYGEDSHWLIPVLSSSGKNIIGFERSVNPALVRNTLGNKERVFTTLGAWAGRHVEEAIAQRVNQELVNEIISVWENRDEGTDHLFNDVSVSDDPVIADAWNLIPQITKEELENRFKELGVKGVMIRDDHTNTVLGYREFSLADLWSGTTNLPKRVTRAVRIGATVLFDDNAMRRLVKSHQGLQRAVSTAKDLIVIRSLVVIIQNNIWNTLQLITRGVPVENITKTYPAALREISAYVKRRKEIIKQQLELRIFER